METTIKGLFRLDRFLEHDHESFENKTYKDKLEYAAKQYLRFSRITFKVTKDTDTNGTQVYVEVRQGKNPNGNYADRNKLVEIAKEVFKDFDNTNGCQLFVRPVPYAQAPTDEVDSPWILQQMQKHKISLKTLVADTGVDKTSMSAYVNGLKPLSQTVKSMFYYYFKSL